MGHNKVRRVLREQNLH